MLGHLLFLASLSIFQVSNGFEVECQTDNFISYMNTTYYFPDTWRENETAPFLKTNQQCRWTISIPKNKFALFTMAADIGADSTLKVTDGNGKSETIMTSEQQPYVFVSQNFTVDLRVGTVLGSTKFGFKIEWNDYPTPNPAYYNVSKTSEALVFDEMLFENAVILTAETKVSLVAFPSPFPDFTSLLRLTLVFDGPSIDSPYLGSLYQAVRSNKPIVSQGNQMTVFTFQADYVVGSFFVIQDYSNIEKQYETKGVTCWSESSCPVTLNAANGPVSAMTINLNDGNEYVKKLDLTGNGVLKVYIGARREGNDSNLIVSYNTAQSQSNIPQKFNGDLMTYYLEEGSALVELAQDENYTRWNDAVSGREGFISSKYYGYLAVEQDVFDFIGGKNANDSYNFKINVTHVDISRNASLKISFCSQSGTVDYRYSSDQFDTTIFSEIGDNMTVSYFTNDTVSTGFYLDFKIDQIMPSGVVGRTQCWITTFIIILLICIFN